MKSIGRLALVLTYAAALAAGLPAMQDAAAGDYPAAAVLYGTLAPHGRQLYVADGDGSHVRPLLADAVYDYNANVSPDGHWVVFTSERSGPPDIFRVRLDGTGLQQLTDHPAFDDSGALSPDGHLLAFVSTRETGNANIWVLELETGRLTNLTAGSIGDYMPSWSPDGEWIAFSSIRDSTPLEPGSDPAGTPRRFRSDIYAVRRDGSGLKRLSTSGRMFSPRWSPDGRHIVAVQEDPLPPVASMRVGPNGLPDPSVGQQLLNSVSRIVAIAVADGRITELGQAQPRTGARSPQLITADRAAWITMEGIRFSDGTTGASGEFRRPSWTSDGRIMVFHRDHASGRQGAVEAQRSPTAFRFRPAFDPHFTIMRTGSFPSPRPLKDGWIVVNDQPLGAVHNAIMAVSPDGTRQRLVFRHPQLRAVGPAVSPDGSRIAFTLGNLGMATEGQPARLALVNADGSGLIELTAAGHHAAYPGWSPDGSRLVYAHTEPGNRGLRIIDLDTNTITELTTGPDNFPSWSPDGERIAFTRSPHGLGGPSQIYTVKPDGTGLTRLTLHPGAQDAHPAYSPDGRWIAFTSARINPRTEPTDLLSAHHAIGQIFVMRADGSDLRQLTDTEYNSGTPAWRELPAD